MLCSKIYDHATLTGKRRRKGKQDLLSLYSKAYLIISKCNDVASDWHVSLTSLSNRFSIVKRNVMFDLHQEQVLR